MPPLCVTKAEVDEAMQLLRVSLDEALAGPRQLSPAPPAPAAVAALVVAAAASGRARTGSRSLKQIDLPHSYYWRELYLPQLTTGPSSASFLPDGRAS